MAISKAHTALMAKIGAFKGNAITPVQFSSFIRPVDQTECNGKAYMPGELRNFDLDPFWRRYPFCAQMSANFKNQTCVLYVWRNDRAGVNGAFGATLTDESGNILTRGVLSGMSRPCAARAWEVLAALESMAGLIPKKEAA